MLFINPLNFYIMKMHNFNNYVAYCEALGMSKVWEAYANFCASEDIFEIGFNPNSGYVYIHLIGGISICSCLGQDVVYHLNDPETGEDVFFEVYEQAVNHTF